MEDPTKLVSSGVGVVAVEVTLETVDEGELSPVEDVSVVELAMDLEESIENALLELGMA